MKSKAKEYGLFITGIAICFAVAGLSVLVESLIPGELLGASIIALFLGTIIHTFFHPTWIKPALKFASKKILKIAIILLGASLSVNTIMSVLPHNKTINLSYLCQEKMKKLRVDFL